MRQPAYQTRHNAASASLTLSIENSAGNTPQKPGDTAHSHAGSLASKQVQSHPWPQGGKPQVAETAVLRRMYTGSFGI